MEALRNRLLSTDSGSCLDESAIRRYVAGRLSRDDEYRIDLHLVDCPMCADAVEGARLIPEEAAERHLLSLDMRFRSRVAEKPRWFGGSWLPYLAAAALVIVAFGVSKWASRPSVNKQLADKYFKPYSSIIPQPRHNGSPSDLAGALAEYELGNYGEAGDRLRTILEREPGNTLASFYLGIIHLARHEHAGAQPLLEAVRSSGDGRLTGAATWYLALSYLSGDRVDSARALLKELSASDTFYAEKSRQLLRELDAR